MQPHNRFRESPAKRWHQQPGSCELDTTKAGSTMTISMSCLTDGFAAATWEPVITTTTLPPATRPVMFGVVHLQATTSRSSPRKKQEPERSRFRLTAISAPRWTCQRQVRVKLSKEFVK